MRDVLEEAKQEIKRLQLELMDVVHPVTDTPRRPKRESPVSVYVKNLEKIAGERYYMASQVAEELGVSAQAIRKYAKAEVCGVGVAPSKMAELGGLKVFLYTEDDVEALRQFLGKRNVIRKVGDGTGDSSRTT